MNRPIVVIGLIVFVIFLIFPAFHYRTLANVVLPERTRLPPSFETRLLPFWHNGEIYKNEKLIGTGGKIYTDLCYGLLGGVAFVSFAQQSAGKDAARSPFCQEVKALKVESYRPLFWCTIESFLAGPPELYSDPTPALYKPQFLMLFLQKPPAEGEGYALG